VAFTSQGDQGLFFNNGDGWPVNYLITSDTRYTAAQCASRSCTPGALVVPGLVQGSITVPLVPAGTVRHLPRVNQIDLGLRRRFMVGGVSVTPRVDVFNLLNADTELSSRSFLYGTPAYGLPGGVEGVIGLLGINTGTGAVLPARLARVSLQMSW
jgi:hypothetical protein